MKTETLPPKQNKKAHNEQAKVQHRRRGPCNETIVPNGISAKCRRVHNSWIYRKSAAPPAPPVSVPDDNLHV